MSSRAIKHMKLKLFIILLIVFIVFSLGLIRFAEKDGFSNGLTHQLAKLGVIDEKVAVTRLRMDARNAERAKQYEKAIVINGKIINSTWYSEDMHYVRVQVLLSYVNYLKNLKKLNRIQEIPDLASMAISRFPDYLDVDFNTHVANIYIEKISAMDNLNYPQDEIIEVCEKMFESFGNGLDVSSYETIRQVNVTMKTSNQFISVGIVDGYVILAQVYNAIQLNKKGGTTKANEILNRIIKLLMPPSSSDIEMPNLYLINIIVNQFSMLKDNILIQQFLSKLLHETVFSLEKTNRKDLVEEYSKKMLKIDSFDK